MSSWSVRSLTPLVGALLFASLMSGCTGSDEAEQQIRDQFAAVPADVSRALQLRGEIEITEELPTFLGIPMRGELAVQLKAGKPLPTTLGRTVAFCRAAVAAVAPTSGRLYGKFPDDARWFEATDALCQRGLGYVDDIYSSMWRLKIGLPQGDGQALDTFVSLDPAEATAETSSYDRRDPRNKTFTVSDPVLAELDAAIKPTKLPWRYSAEDATQRGDGRLADLTFVVPAGTRLQVRADAWDPPTPSSSFSLSVIWERNELLSSPSPSPSLASAAPARATSSQKVSMIEPLKPQFSYPSATGKRVDRYQLSVRGAIPLSATVRVEVVP